jgi:hypothetical protein
MPEQRVSGPLAFTVDSAGAIKGGAAYVRLIANGTNVPTFSGMSEHGSSMGYDGRAGIANLITFWWDGSEYFYSIAQSVNATPQLLGNSLRLSSGAMSESGSAKSWVYTGAAGFSSRESSAKTMPADGTFGFQIGTHGTAHTATVALNTYSAPTTNWTAVSFGLYGDTPSGNWMVLKTGSPGLAANGNAALPHAVGDQARMRRAGSSIFCEVSKDNGATWTLVHTFSGVAAGTLYPSVFSFGQASVAIGTYEIGLP